MSLGIGHVRLADAQHVFEQRSISQRGLAQLSPIPPLSADQKRYAYHWEQRAKRGLLHRHDNAPDHPEIAAHPKHFHNGAEDEVEESSIADDPRAALREFLKFVTQKLEGLGE